MRAYAYNQSGGDLPTPIDDYPGKGRAVQMDRMITMDISFTDPDVKPINNPIDNKPSAGSHIQFIHSANSVSLSRYAKYTFGYVSPKLLDAMAGMRAGGRRRVQITDFTCENTFQSKFLSDSNGNQCGALGAVREGPYGARFGAIYYPRGKPVVANLFIADELRLGLGLKGDRPEIVPALAQRESRWPDPSHHRQLGKRPRDDDHDLVPRQRQRLQSAKAFVRLEPRAQRHIFDRRI